jgi:hypothetical protein
MMSMVLDYMVSDAFVKSKGRISFPGHFAEGYAYLQSKVYGDKQGQIYDHKNVRLWMPKDVINVSNNELNYLTGYNDNKFFIVLTNQSKERIETEINLNPKLISMNATHTIELWQENNKQNNLTLQNGNIQIETAPEGISVLIVNNMVVKPKFQNTFSDQQPLKNSSYGKIDLGNTNCMLMTIGEEFTTAYIYCEATFEDFKQVSFNYKLGNEWTSIEDTSYPFELTFDVPSDIEEVEIYIEAKPIDGPHKKSKSIILER